ncbi:hypothetical protein NKI38_19365 [Mesorhizobium sp. M0621]|uniref:hypothetical protein n=1 Tax=Mesorhizobium sp. M0621 TaxID=2956974 RepID=UPI0033354A0A
MPRPQGRIDIGRCLVARDWQLRRLVNHISMSARRHQLSRQLMSDHLPDAMTDDPVAISDLADEAMRTADKAGIPAAEINEEVRSVLEAFFDAMQHRAGGLAD